jgi:hypothetical protein
VTYNVITIGKQATRRKTMSEVDEMFHDSLMYDAMHDQISKRIVGKCFVSFSAYETKDDGKIINNLNDIVAEGDCCFFSEATEFYGGEKSKNYFSNVINNPTWLDVCALANDAIIVTKDHHHVFLEGVRHYETDKNNVKWFEFELGS